MEELSTKNIEIYLAIRVEKSNLTNTDAHRQRTLLQYLLDIIHKLIKKVLND